MIKNMRQYKITRGCVSKFKEAKEQTQEDIKEHERSLSFAKITLAALEGEIKTLTEQMDEYNKGRK